MHRTTGEYFRALFGCKVFKIPLHAGLTCPNRDGTKGGGGCTYCNNQSFSPNTRGSPLPVRQQIREGMAFYARRGGKKFIPYFQSFTNTYAPVEYLHSLYEQALGFDGVVGLSIGTRADCLQEEVLDLLSSIQSKGFFVIVELGLESSHDQTLKRLNRGHTFAEFVEGAKRVKEKGFFLTAHLILGLPGESREEILETARRVAQLPVDALKLHHFYVAKGTIMEKKYKNHEFSVLELDAYIELAADFLSLIPQHVLIERLVGETNPAYVVAPLWHLPKPAIVQAIRQRLWQKEREQCFITQKGGYHEPS